MNKEQILEKAKKQKRKPLNDASTIDKYTCL